MSRLSLRLVFTSIIAFAVFNSYSQYTLKKSGDWAKHSNWTPTGVPGSGSIVVIPEGLTVTIDEDASCETLELKGALQIEPGRSFNVVADLTTGNYSSIVLGYNSNLLLSGGFSKQTNSLYFFPGKVTYNGNHQTIVPATYGKLVLKNAGTKALGGNIVLTGSMEVEDGATFYTGQNNVSGAGSFTLDQGTYFITDHANGMDGTITVSGSTFFNSNANYQFNGASTGSFTTSPVAGEVNNLTINSDSVISLSSSKTVKGKLEFKKGNLALGNHKLTIKGTVAGPGKLQCDASSELEVQSADASLGFDSKWNKLKKLTINKGGKLTLLDTLVLLGESADAGLVLEESSALITNDQLVLGSSAKGTAAIAGIPTDANGQAKATITGKVIAQRYVPGKRAYRFVGHPFNIDMPLSILTPLMDITGKGGAVNGFTPTGTNNPSVYWYNNNAGWTAFTNTNGAGLNAWKPHQGIRLMVRGSKGQGLTTTNYVPNDVVLQLSGNVNTGDITVLLTKGAIDGFNLVANPYPSAVNMSAVVGSADNVVGSGYWVWDAMLGTQGAYAAIPVADDYYVPSGSAVFVKVMANTTLRFKEIYKAAEPSGKLMKGASKSNRITVELATATIYWDRVHIIGNSLATDSSEQYDADKMANPDADLFTLAADSTKLSIDARPLSSKTVIPIGLKAANGNYTLHFTNLSIADTLSAMLIDTYTGASLPLFQGSSYTFSVSADASSKGDNRLRIAFSSSTTLAINDVVLQGKIEGRVAMLNWAVQSTNAVKSFEIYRSGNGQQWQLIKTLPLEQSSTNYSYSDYEILQGDNLYRLKLALASGEVAYTATLKLSLPVDNSDLLKCYPNPVCQRGKLYLDATIMQAGNYTVSITNLAGVVVATRQQNLQRGHATFPLNLDYVAPGIYVIRLTSNEQVLSTQITIQ